MICKNSKDFLKRVNGLTGNIKFAFVGKGTSWKLCDGADADSVDARDGEEKLAGTCRRNGDKIKFLLRGDTKDLVTVKSKIFGLKKDDPKLTFKVVTVKEDEDLEAVRAAARNLSTEIRTHTTDGPALLELQQSVFEHAGEGELAEAKAKLHELQRRLSGAPVVPPRAPNPANERKKAATQDVKKFGLEARALAETFKKLNSRSDSLPELAEKIAGVGKLCADLESDPAKLGDAVKALLDTQAALEKYAKDHGAKHGQDKQAAGATAMAKKMSEVLNSVLAATDGAALLGTLDTETLLRCGESVEGKELDALVSNVLSGRDAHPQVIKTIMFDGIANDIATVKDGEMPLRGNDFRTKLLTAYGKVVGKDAITNSTAPAFQAFARVNRPLEVDPFRLTKKDTSGQQQVTLSQDEQNELDGNLDSHRDLAKSLVEHFISDDNLNTFPDEIKEIAAQIYSAGVKRYPLDGPEAQQNKKTVVGLVGGYVMLRLVNPSIITQLTDEVKVLHEQHAEAIKKRTEKKWLTAQDVTDLKAYDEALHRQRAAVLQTKIIQNLSNGVRFDVKEPYMMPFNDLFDTYQSQMEAAFLKLAGVG